MAEIADDLQKTRQFKDGTTVVARVRDGSGNIHILAATEGSTKLSKAACAAAGVTRIPGGIKRIGKDAEVNLLNYCKENGLKIIEGGTSRNVCLECKKQLNNHKIRVAGEMFMGARADKSLYRTFWRTSPVSS